MYIQLLYYCFMKNWFNETNFSKKKKGKERSKKGRKRDREKEKKKGEKKLKKNLER